MDDSVRIGAIFSGNEMLDLSIIIVNWNARELLAKCLGCVESTVKKVNYETIVVDNHSSDGSQDMVRAQFPNVKLIENSDNKGFAAANNQGIQISQGRYVLLLNSDAFVKENTLDTMVAFMDEHPEAGMAGCKLLYEDGSLQPSCNSFPTLATEFYTALGLDKLFPNSREFGKYAMGYWDYSEMREVDVLMGAFMIVRKTAIDQVGMMDASYFMYSEEVDWCFQFKKSAWKIYFYPFVEAVHLWGGTSKQVRVEMFVQMFRSRVKFFRKNYGATSAMLLKLILGFYALIRVVPGAVYYRLLKHDPAFQQKHIAFQRMFRALPTF
jgi:GT2 family glycosyltransferase